MTSNDQIAANRANSELSTGPRTEEGKARSSQNSLKHGVFAKTIVLPGESQEEFDALFAGLRKDHSPVGETASNLVRGLAEIQWRLDRLRRYEGAATGEALETGNFESKALLNCTLIEQRLLRAFQLTVKLLKDAQAPRLAKREEDLCEACDLRQFHQMNNLAWTPEQDGFVFSLAEIDARIDFEAASKWRPGPSNTPSGPISARPRNAGHNSGNRPPADAVLLEAEENMEKRRIGSLDVTVVGLGCNNFGWRIDAGATVPVVDAALEAGINFFDTADIYDHGHSEEYLARALGNRRKDVIIATKFGMKMDEGKQGAHPDYIRQAAEDSLRRLRTDYIDLYQLHQPDPTVPIADTLGALDELVRTGKVREVGASNFSADQIRSAHDARTSDFAGFVSVQNNYSLMYREPENAGVIAICEDLGFSLIPYFPLANGLLTGKYRKGQPHPPGSRGQMGFGPKVFTPENLELVDHLTTFAEAQGHTIIELSFSWLLAQKVVSSVIAGATSAAQVKTNASAGGWKLTQDELRQVDHILGRHLQPA